MNSTEDVWQFEKLEQQLHSFLAEISGLSDKKPNDALNKFKLKFINEMLQGLNRLIGDHRPFPDFQTFDIDDIPSNSDAAIILAQYATATYNFRRDHTKYLDHDHRWHWLVKNRGTGPETQQPAHFKYEKK